MGSSLNSVKCPAKPGNNQQVRICPQVRLGAGLSLGSAAEARHALQTISETQIGPGRGFCWDQSQPAHSSSHPLARLAEQS